MTRLTCLFFALVSTMMALGQHTETTQKKADTISYNKMVIIIQRETKKKGADTLRIVARKTEKTAKRHSMGGGFDFGWSNYLDHTNYSQAALSGVVASGIDASDLKLKLGASRNVNLWFVMDDAPLIKKTLRFQYGFGLELNNYTLDSRNVYFYKNPTYVYSATTPYKKAKLAADYISVPLMLKLNLTPHRQHNPFTIAGGVSGGFLYSARFKTKNSGDVSKIRSDFDLEQFKFSYVGELGLGPIKLYGSYAMKDMFKNTLNMTPYTIGFRFVD